MNNQLVSIHDGKLTTTSLIVAEHFNKAHRSVLTSIRRLECSPEFTEHNFLLSQYKDNSGKENPCYNITRDGFMFLVMGFTGKEAAVWKERFINAFNAMEKKLRDEERSSSIIHELRGKSLSMNIEYDGKVYFYVKEPTDTYAELAKAIADPDNIGLHEDKILMIVKACIDALAYRAKTSKECISMLRKAQNSNPKLL